MDTKRNGRRVALLCSQVLVLTVIAVTVVAAAAQQLANQWYADPKGYFRIVPPAGWRIQEYPGDARGKVAFFGPNEVEQRVLTNAVDFDTVEELVTFCRNTESRLGLDTHIKRVSFDGRPAVERSFEVRGTKFLYIDFLVGRIAHNLAYGAPLVHYEMYLPAAKASMETYMPSSREASAQDATKHAVAKLIRIAQLMLECGNKELALECVREGLALDGANPELLRLKAETEGSPERARQATSRTEPRKEQVGVVAGLSSQVYTDPKGFFRIRPPAEWIVEEYKSEPRGKVNFNWVEGGRKAQLKLIGAANPFADFDALLQDCKNGIQAIQARWGATCEIKTTTLLGEKAVLILSSIPKLSFGQYQVQVLSGGSYYTVGYGGHDQVYDKYLSLAKLSIETLEALPRNAKPGEAQAHILASKIRIARLYTQIGKDDWALSAISEGLAIDPKNEELLQLRKRIAGQNN